MDESLCDSCIHRRVCMWEVGPGEDCDEAYVIHDGTSTVTFEEWNVMVGLPRAKENLKLKEENARLREEIRRMQLALERKNQQLKLIGGLNEIQSRLHSDSGE